MSWREIKKVIYIRRGSGRTWDRVQGTDGREKRDGRIHLRSSPSSFPTDESDERVETLLSVIHDTIRYGEERRNDESFLTGRKGPSWGAREEEGTKRTRGGSFRFVSFSFFLSFSRTSFDLFHADESGVALSFSLLLSPLFHRARARDYFLWAGTLSVSASEGKKYSGIETNSFSYVPTRWPCIYIYICI